MDNTILRYLEIPIPGIDVTSGSLGHGLGIDWIAQSFIRKKLDNRVFVFLSEVNCMKALAGKAFST